MQDQNIFYPHVCTDIMPNTDFKTIALTYCYPDIFILSSESTLSSSQLKINKKKYTHVI